MPRIDQKPPYTGAGAADGPEHDNALVADVHVGRAP